HLALLVAGKLVPAAFQIFLENAQRFGGIDLEQALFERVEIRREFAAELADERKRQPVKRTRSEPANRVLVLRRAVAFVLREAVARIFFFEILHPAIAIGFRDDGGGGDGEIEAVALVE